jgi:lipopolysaccharide/colanic/teichoic acid biosynthesis glycosyltransferase
VLKRAFDVLVAGSVLVVLSPLVAAVALLVMLESSGPMLFRQTRVGKDGRLFEMIKFRTMPAAPEAPDGSSSVPEVSDFKEYVFDPLHGGRKYTRIGGFLRSTSLDELPNLVNVLRGEMSIVGPRPEVPEFVEQYPPEYTRRHAVRPGITGLAQVNGRSDLTYHEAMLYDLDYVDHQSFFKDVGILLRTVPTVLSRKGAR